MNAHHQRLPWLWTIPDREVRYRAIRALEAAGPAARIAMARLTAALEDENHMVQNVARRTIGKLEKAADN